MTVKTDQTATEQKDEQRQYDVITVGGGLAGSAFATAMARQGARVLVLERETEFQDRVRGEWLAPWGAADARELGLTDALRVAGAQPLPSLAGRSGKPRFEATPEGDVAITFSHPALQEALLQEAARASATVVRGARVREVTGAETPSVRYELDGETRTATARLVVGADGRSSLVRRAIGKRPQTHHSDRLLAGVRLANVVSDPAFGYFVLRDDARGVVMLFPQGDDHARAYVFVDGEDAGTYSGSDGFQSFVDALVAGGIPAEVVANATQAGPLATFRADDSWIEHPVQDGLVLIGDAAGMSDPTWGMGIALAFHDARVLSTALGEGADWSAAADAYARERDRYFVTVVTAELWQDELLLTPGPEADERRRHAQQAWKADSTRVLGLPALGPDVDTSERARRRFFAEDVPAAEHEQSDSSEQSASGEEDIVSVRATSEASILVQHKSGEIMSAQTVSKQPAPAAASEVERRAIGEAFVNALVERDFERLGSLLAPTMRMRSLLAHGHEDFHGSHEVMPEFFGWFAGDHESEVLRTHVGVVGDRLLVSYHFRLNWPEPHGPVEIEQTGYMKVQDGKIVTIDLLCSGFRPAAPAAAVEAEVAVA